MTHFSYQFMMAQWLELWTVKQEIAGSSPANIFCWGQPSSAIVGQNLLCIERARLKNSENVRKWQNTSGTRLLKSIPQSFVLLLVHGTILPTYWRIFVFSRRYCENNYHELLPDVITDLIQKKRHFVIATYFSCCSANLRDSFYKGTLGAAAGAAYKVAFFLYQVCDTVW